MSAETMAETKKKPRVILALDIDAFYAQAETVREPALRGRPVGVQQKNVIITTTYEARAFGIQKGDSVKEVRRKCPEIVIKNGEDLSYYVQLSERWRDFVERFSGCPAEKLGLDELFVDVTSVVEPRDEPTGHVLHGDDEEDRLLYGGAALCEALRTAVFREIGLTTSGGVARAKVLAKLATSVKKPFAQTTVLAGAVRQLIKDDAPLRSIPGIGAATAKILADDFGVTTVGECRRQRRAEVFGPSKKLKVLETARRLCDGDDAPVKPSTKAPKTVGVEDSYWSHAAGDAPLDALVDKLAKKIDVLRPKLPRFADAVIVAARFDVAEGRTSRRRAGRLALDGDSLRRRVLAVAEDLLRDLNPLGRSLINLSVGLKLPDDVAADSAAPRIDAFLVGNGSGAKPKKEEPSPSGRKRYEAPSAEELDEDVLAALPEDVRADLERQKALAANASSSKHQRRRHDDKQHQAAHLFFQPRRKPQTPPSSEDVAAIVAMGFDAQRARTALQRHSGSLARAVEALLSNEQP